MTLGSLLSMDATTPTAEATRDHTSHILNPAAYAARCAFNARVDAWRAVQRAARKAQRAADEAQREAEMRAAQAHEKALCVRLAFEAREYLKELLDEEYQSNRKCGASNVATAIAIHFDGACAEDIARRDGITFDNVYQRCKRGCTWLEKNGSEEMGAWMRARKGAWK